MRLIRSSDRNHNSISIQLQIYLSPLKSPPLPSKSLPRLEVAKDLHSRPQDQASARTSVRVPFALRFLKGQIHSALRSCDSRVGLSHVTGNASSRRASVYAVFRGLSLHSAPLHVGGNAMGAVGMVDGHAHDHFKLLAAHQDIRRGYVRAC